MRSSTRLVVVLAFAATQGCADPADPPAPEAQSDLLIDVVMRGSVADVMVINAGTKAEQLLSWYLPTDELQEPLFVVTRDGQPVRYTGAHYKRAQPDASDRVTIAPNAELSWQVDLAKYYDFSQSGDYTVQVRIDAASLGAGSGVLTSATSVVWVEGRTVEHEKPVRDTCSASEKALIADATGIAGGYANAASSYLNGSPSATQRYTTWFGAFSSSGWNTARSHFAAIANAFNTQTITPDCRCKQKNVYAYVYPDQPYSIYLCGAFWSAPTGGTDSKAGTLVHEMSHFNVTASTDDVAYGKTACLALAQSDPAGALNNADSHEYFAENTPALP